MGSKRKRRWYTEAERATVVGDVARLGVNAAAKKHGVSQGCVSRWAAAAGVKRRRGGTARATGRDTGGGKVAAPQLAGATTPAKRGRVAKLYTPSQKAETLEYASAHGVSSAAEHFSISRFSIYDWQRKAKK